MRFIFDKIENSFARNVSYSLSASIVSLVVGITVILLVPKVIGVREYGYFQLFILLISCSGFSQFGWISGVVLRYAGIQWEEINRPRFAGQIHYFLLFEVLLWGVFAWGSYLYFKEGDQLFVLLCTAFGAVIVLLDSLLKTILQAANRIKVFAFLSFLDRFIYLVAVLIALLVRVRDFRFFIIAFLLARIASMIVGIWFCRALVFCRGEDFPHVLKEAKTSLRAGAKILFASIASLMILFVIRLGIERVWGIETFGKISLLLSSISILFIFADAVSVALFPALRRENIDHIRALYYPCRIALSWLLLVCFIFSYPAAKILCLWLPNYADAMDYLPLVLPLSLFECAVSILIGTYLKVLRCERDLLVANCLALALSVALFCLFGFALKNLPLTVLSMTIAIAVRAWILERKLATELHVQQSASVFTFEVIASVVLIASGMFASGWTSVLIYVSFLVASFVVKRKTLLETLSIAKYNWEKSRPRQ